MRFNCILYPVFISYFFRFSLDFTQNLEMIIHYIKRMPIYTFK